MSQLKCEYGTSITGLEKLPCTFYPATQSMNTGHYITDSLKIFGFSVFSEVFLIQCRLFCALICFSNKSIAFLYDRRSRHCLCHVTSGPRCIKGTRQHFHGRFYVMVIKVCLIRAVCTAQKAQIRSRSHPDQVKNVRVNGKHK
jgi:hypothetical protein